MLYKLACIHCYTFCVYIYIYTHKLYKDGLWLSLEKADFNGTFFPSNWDNLLDIHGQGTKIYFPVKVRHFISWSPLQHVVNALQPPRSYLEKMSMDFIKVAA